MEKIKRLKDRLETLLVILFCQFEKDLECWCRLQSRSFPPDLRVSVAVPVMRLTNRQLILPFSVMQLLVLPYAWNMHGLSSEHDAQSTSIAALCTLLDTLRQLYGSLSLRTTTSC